MPPLRYNGNGRFVRDAYMRPVGRGRNGNGLLSHRPRYHEMQHQPGGTAEAHGQNRVPLVLAQHKECCQEAARADPVDVGEAVSYTHLDVYKRQV